MKLPIQLVIACASLLLQPCASFAEEHSLECAKVSEVMGKACASSDSDKKLGSQMLNFCRDFMIGKKAADEKLRLQNSACAEAGKKTNFKGGRDAQGVQSRAVTGHAELVQENQKSLEDCAKKLGLLQEDYKNLTARAERAKAEVERVVAPGLSPSCKEAAVKAFDFLHEGAETRQLETKIEAKKYTDAAKAVEEQGKKDKNNAENMKGGDQADKGGGAGGAPPVPAGGDDKKAKKDPRAEAEKVRAGKILECKTAKKELQNELSTCRNTHRCVAGARVEPLCSNLEKCELGKKTEYRARDIYPERNCEDIPLVILPMP